MEDEDFNHGEEILLGGAQKLRIVRSRDQNVFQTFRKPAANIST